MDYQSAKAARRVTKKDQVEHEKIRHPSDASHCSSEKSVGEFDAAESLIVLSSTTSQKDQCPNTFQLPSQECYRGIKMEQDEQLKPQSNFSHGNTSIKITQTTPTVPCTAIDHPNIANTVMSVNSNPMDLSPANSSQLLPFKPHTISQSSSFPDAPKLNFNSQQSGSNHQSSLLTCQNLHPHRQVMTVTPVADHVALVDTVLNAPSMPTMVIPMDDLEQHKIQHLNPNTSVFPIHNMNGSKLVSDGR